MILVLRPKSTGVWFALGAEAGELQTEIATIRETAYDGLLLPLIDRSLTQSGNVCQPVVVIFGQTPLNVIQRFSQRFYGGSGLSRADSVFLAVV